MSRSEVKRQAERVIDEGRGSQREVLVQLGGVDADAKAFLRAARRNMDRWARTTHARELVPGRKGRRKKARRSKSTLRSAARRELRPFLKSSALRRSLAAEATCAPTELWTANAVRLELHKDDLLRLVSEEPAIRAVFPNRRHRLPRVARPRSLPQNVRDNKASSWGVTATGALAAWGAYGARGDGVTVAVLDTGVDDTHPDLQGRISDWAELDATGNLVAGSTPRDSDRHGTHVAGTVVGGNASGSWIGVAPDARVAAALVLDGEVGGTDAQVLAGIDWAVDLGVDVISMSLGGLTLGPDTPTLYANAILSAARAGIPVVVAIGNDGEQTTGSPGNDFLALSVGATDSRDVVAGFSGGRTMIIRESSFLPPSNLPLPYSKPDLSAPGVDVVSSVPGGAWEAFNGTSMATPHVSGAVALLLSASTLRDELAGPDLYFEILNLLVGAVEELGESGRDHRYGHGRLDVLRAIGFARDAGYV